MGGLIHERGGLGNGHVASEHLTANGGILTCIDGIVECRLIIDLGCVLCFGTAGWEIAGLQSGEFAHGAGRDAKGEDNGYESNSGGYKGLHVCGNVGMLPSLSEKKRALSMVKGLGGKAD